MMMNEIKELQALWNMDETERSEAMGPIEDPKPDITDEEMFIDLIELYGLEATVVVNFAQFMEAGLDHKNLRSLYEIIVEYPELYM